MPVRTVPLAKVDAGLAKRVGLRIRAGRRQAGLTQQQLAGDRYTKAYISALENGLVKPSVAALNFLAERLGVRASTLLDDEAPAVARLMADLHLASGSWEQAADAYLGLLDDALDAGRRAEVQRGLAEAYCRLDRPAEAVRASSEAAEAFERLGRPADAATARYWQAYGLHQLANSTDARGILADLTRQVREGLQVDPDFKVRLLVAAAAVESTDERSEQALGYLEEARTLVADLDDRRRAAYYLSLATTYRDLGDQEGAIRSAREALALFRGANAEFEAASVDNELSLAYMAMGNLERAEEHVASARHRFEVLADERWLAHITETEAQLALARGDAERARSLAQDAVAAAETQSNEKALLSALLTLARAERAVGSSDAARAALERGVAKAREVGRSRQLRSLLIELAEVRDQAGDPRGAYELTREAAALR